MKHQNTYKIKQFPTSKKIAKIINGDKRNHDEKYAAELLVKFGHDVLFLNADKRKGVHTPDCYWNGKHWEIKTIHKNSYNTIETAIKSARKQSDYIILHISFTKRSIERVSFDIAHYLKTHTHNNIKQIFILNKTRYCLISRDMLK